MHLLEIQFNSVFCQWKRKCIPQVSLESDNPMVFKVAILLSVVPQDGTVVS